MNGFTVKNNKWTINPISIDRDLTVKERSIIPLSSNKSHGEESEPISHCEACLQWKKALLLEILFGVSLNANPHLVLYWIDLYFSFLLLLFNLDLHYEDSPLYFLKYSFFYKNIEKR